MNSFDAVLIIWIFPCRCQMSWDLPQKQSAKSAISENRRSIDEKYHTVKTLFGFMTDVSNLKKGFKSFLFQNSMEDHQMINTFQTNLSPVINSYVLISQLALPLLSAVQYISRSALVFSQR